MCQKPGNVACALSFNYQVTLQGRHSIKNKEAQSENHLPKVMQLVNNESGI